MIKKIYPIIIFTGFLIGIIHGTIITLSLNIFFSWILIGIWVAFTLKFFIKIKTHREFNSPHNTSFFILGSLVIGLLYLFWGYFTEIFGWNLLAELDMFIFTNIWIVVFSLPYLVYGLFIIYKVLRKYRIVYLIRDRAVNARKFGIILVLIVLLMNVGFMIFILIGQTAVNFLTPSYTIPGIIFLIFNLILISEFIAFGLIKRGVSLSDLSPSALRRRRARISSLDTAARRRARQPRSIRSRTSGTSRPRQTSRSSPKTKRRKTTRSTPQSTKKISRSTLSKMRPITGNLHIDDFKCIFCFNLPKLPDDNGRGIVLCPSCRYPAHLDEFKDWMRSSDLCSRCGAKISLSYRRNPKVIPVRIYVKAIKYLLKYERSK